MIKTFKHRGLQRYFETGSPKAIPSAMRKRIQIRLNALDRAKELRDLNLPGFGFHSLKGDRKGVFAIKARGNYRLTFRFENGDVLDLILKIITDGGFLGDGKKKEAAPHASRRAA